MKRLVETISAAFSSRRYPGDENITHCTLDRRNGGTHDGPCWECEEMAEYFRGKSWAALTGSELRRYGDNDSLFTASAYCYFLPAYLVAAIREPKALDDCVDHLTYRFGPEPTDEFGRHRLAAICAELTVREMTATLEYFRSALQREPDFEGYCERSIRSLELALKNAP